MESASELVPPALARLHRLAPRALEEGTLVVAFEEPPGEALLAELQFITGRPVSACAASSGEVEAFLKELGEEPGAAGQFAEGQTASDQIAGDRAPNGQAVEESGGSVRGKRGQEGKETEAEFRAEAEAARETAKEKAKQRRAGESARARAAPSGPNASPVAGAREESTPSEAGAQEGAEVATAGASSPEKLPESTREGPGGLRAKNAVPLEKLRFEGAPARQVDQIIGEAARRGASDIHVEPYEDFFRVRYRLDGVLHEAGRLPLGRQRAVLSRIKILAELDIAERRRPQDGRITIEEGNSREAVDLRVSTLPVAGGREKAVLRLLDRRDVALELEALGFSPEGRQVFEQAVGRPHGLILVTGPTGSGKTTTLYSALRRVATGAVNVQTIEDPVEYQLAGVNQAQARPGIGFGFAEALRAFLRQDPDVIMVGEIRDAETAEMALRAALTGHLVLSTLHTNSAPGAAARLVDMGAAPYLVASALRLAVAQRLVRRVCPACRTERTLKMSERERLGLPAGQGACTYGAGCPACSGTGYQGRQAVFELMPVSEALAQLLAEGGSTMDLRRQAQEEGMAPLRAAASALVEEGVTTPGEALRQTAL